ncbi:MAG: hypothetical protein KDD52_09955 [Bdellovibrionales bacterium]|nr:hypothetical protein [Bdellovibrionales bacterium]
MNHNKYLDRYLESLDKALKGVSVGEKADIITEIRSHILDALERDDQNLRAILDSLGEPQQVANRYLLERGITIQPKPLGYSLVKWISAGFLTTLCVVVIALTLLIWKLSPIVKVDEINHRVQILGGLIDVQSDDIDFDKWKNMDFSVDWDDDDFPFSLNASREKITREGELSVSSSSDLIFSEFTNGKFSLSQGDKEGVLKWKCETRDKNSEQKFEELQNRKDLDFSDFSGLKCEIWMPTNRGVELKGLNGYVVINEPEVSVSAKLSNGKMSFFPKDGMKYNFDTRVNVGRLDEFESVSEAQAKITLRVGNGFIDNKG